MTQGASDTKTEGESEGLSSTFRDFFSLGAGVTLPKEAGKPTASFTFNKVICPSLRCRLTVLADRAMRLSSEYESSFIAGMHP
jgi:hypothetical protein